MHTRGTIIALLTASLGAAALGAEGTTAQQPRRTIGAGEARMPVYRVDLGPVKTQLYTTGEVVMSPAEQVWRPVCGSDPAAVTEARLREIAQNHEAIVANAGENVVVIDRGTRGAGMDVIYNLTGTIPSGATTSFVLAEEFLESIFSDPITVQVNVSFADLGGGVLGSTSPFYVSSFYTAARNGLIADMDADDTLQSLLPAGSTVPVRYDASTATITNENVVFFTRSSFRACIGTTSGRAADMSYNNTFNWDFDPTNGVGAAAQSLTDVVIHETGHALGFVSGVDFRTNDIDAPDLIRFQRTDGAGDYNPDTTGEFTTTPRTVDFNNPNDDANSDVIGAEYRMSDGNPWQASHFREQGTNIGIMDPAQANGETYIARNYFTQADYDVFDFIGYNYPPCAAPSILDQPDNQHLCQGGSIVLSVVAGEASTYQWTLDGVELVNGGDISGATSTTLTVANASTADAGLYSVIVTANDDGCSAESFSADVQVDAEPIIFTQPPATQDKLEGETMSIGVSTIAPLYTFQWRRNGIDLVEGGRISGSQTDFLTITNLEPGDAGDYDVVLTDLDLGCQRTSTDCVLTVEAVGGECPADCDGNGTLNIDDVDCFVAAFLGSDLAADCDQSGTLNIDDVDCFVASFTAGCP